MLSTFDPINKLASIKTLPITSSISNNGNKPKKNKTYQH